MSNNFVATSGVLYDPDIFSECLFLRQAEAAPLRAEVRPGASERPSHGPAREAEGQVPDPRREEGRESRAVLQAAFFLLALYAASGIPLPITSAHADTSTIERKVIRAKFATMSNGGSPEYWFIAEDGAEVIVNQDRFNTYNRGDTFASAGWRG